ncbi:MAG: NADH-quinone oxidoreductase subunit J [Burkholderiaceae bacterium]|jgi:NADH-quinone oxidoreductase subunit J
MDKTFFVTVFYIFFVIVVFAALRVITARNPVHAALYLVLAFFSAAAIWLLLRAEFLAIVLVLVYVGAVMVLFLFVVMMLDINLDKLREGFWKHLPFAALIGVLIVLEMALVLVRTFLSPESNAPVIPAGTSNTHELGLLIYTHYVFAFEVAAVILLLAIVAAVALTLRRRKDVRGQVPSQQIAVQRADRIRIVSMPSEKKE